MKFTNKLFLPTICITLLPVNALSFTSCNWKIRDNEVDYTSIPLTITNESTSNAIFSIYCRYKTTPLTRNLQYSLDGIDWQAFEWKDENEDYYIDTTVSIPKGCSIQLKGDNASTGWQPPANSGYIHFNMKDTNNASLPCSISGNIMSLIYEDFKDKKDIPTDKCFTSSFSQYAGTGMDKLQSAENLVLPATNLKSECYSFLFSYIYEFKKAPKILPSKTSAIDCYYGMFRGCSNLEAAPEICLENDLAKNALSQMFDQCEKLKEVKIHYTGKFCEQAEVPTNDPFFDWLDETSENGTIYYKPAITGYTPTYRNGSTIPEGWTIRSNW